jgi:hypothetical protein
MKTWYIEKCAA